MLALVLFNPAVLNDGDTFSHLAAGGWMIAHGAVLHTDPFSATRAGAPWVAHEWLSEVLMAAAFRAAGWSGVVVLTACAAAAAFFQLGRHLCRLMPVGAVLVVLVLAASCVTPGMLARPHILALPAFEAWVAGLVIARAEGRAPAWRLLGVMVLWANLHGGFIIGLALVVPLAAEAVLAESEARRAAAAMRWAAFLGAACVACLLTPHGLDGLLLPFRMAGMAQLSSVSEWQPASFATLQPLELLIVIGLYLGLGRGARLPLLRLLVVLGLLHLALEHARHLALVGIIVPLVVAAPFGEALPVAAAPRARPWLPISGAVLASLLVTMRLALPITRTDGPTSPMSALAQVPATMRAQPVLNDYAFGGYLIFEGVHPFIDARAELYGQEFMHRYAEITRPDAAALAAALHAGGVEWTMLAPGNAAVELLDESSAWCRLYADDFAVVHVRCKKGKRAVIF